MRRHLNILICAAALLTAVGCERNGLNSDQQEATPKAIAYASKVAKTKATEVDKTALETYGKLSVEAYMSDGANEHYYGDCLLYDGSSWSSGRNRYWPVGRSLDIFAYSPLSPHVAVASGQNYADYSLRYTTPADIDQQFDLLAYSIKGQSYTVGNGVVLLDMHHILSAIKFNVEIKGESNVTLNAITINYIGIENERVYNFDRASWNPSEQLYFDKTEGIGTLLAVNKTVTSNSSSVSFTDIDNQLMIIPQPVNHDDDDPHYISIQVAYTLNSTLDNSQVAVTTGTMPLPVPNNAYEQGKLYEYNVVINGQTISFKSLDIDDQNDPIPAYGNIDLDLITTTKSAADIGYTGSSETTAQYYFTTSERVKNLLSDGVRDFVVVGSMGAKNTEGNTLGSGKLGYYGSKSSPFYIGGKLAGLGAGAEDLYSVDLRGTYDYPRFADANNDTSEQSKPAVTGKESIGDDEPILVAGLFADIDWLDEVILPHGIAAIGNHSFANCNSLRSIDIADAKHIEIGAFQECYALETVANGKLTRVHEHGFDSCYMLKTIDLSMVTEIDAYGFVDCAQLTNVDLTHLDDIGKHAFNGCSNLTLASGTEIPGFTVVEDYAFSKCYRLGEGGSKIDLTATSKVGEHAFASCKLIELSGEELNVLDTVERYAFSNCYNLGYNQELKMPLLASVDTAAFEDCPYLNIVSGLGNLTKIASSAFQSCSSLTGYAATATDRVLSLPEVTTIESFGLCKSGVTSLAFSDKLTTLDAHALDSCLSLTTITGLDKVTSVGNFAFSTCRMLEELDMPLLTSDNCGDYFFSGCDALKVISLPLLTREYIDGAKESTNYNSIIKMIGGANTSIEYINLKSLVADIPAWHFNGKPNLRYVDFASATSIGDGGFSGGTNIEAIDLRSVTQVGHQLVANCNNVKRLNLSKLADKGNYHEGIFWHFTNSANCELWISDELAPTDGTTNCLGQTWKAVHKASDNVEFNLIVP